MTQAHYPGKGQTAADITLSPVRNVSLPSPCTSSSPQGTHTLTLQFANALHQSYGSKYATTITVKAQ